VPPTEANLLRFNNVHNDAVAFFFTPPQEWANPTDCGTYPCTGPHNILMNFRNTIYGSGLKPLGGKPDFQIIAASPENAEGFSNCTAVSAWNTGYICNNKDLAVLLFESLDEDKERRLFSPVYVQGVNITSRNTLNTMMDHCWDGFYTCLTRLSRFPTLLQGGRNMYYNITTTGTLPNKMKFSLPSSTTSVIIRLRYTQSNAFQVYDYLGNLVAPNAWNSEISAPYTLKGDFGGKCGENRYLGVVNILEVYISPGCNFTIAPIDSIQTNIRMNWTLQQFYASGGTTQF